MANRAVIFDMDGTLVDSRYDWPAIRAELGVDLEPGGLRRAADYQVIPRRIDRQSVGRIVREDRGHAGGDSAQWQIAGIGADGKRQHRTHGN